MYKIWHKWILVCVSHLFLVSTFAQDREPAIRKGKLENGLTYYISQNPYPVGEAVYRLFLKTGSMAEQEAQKGLAHFLEHMAFNGSRHFPGDSLVRFLEKQGAKFGKDLNAHTSYDETVYKLQLPSKDTVLVDQTLTILSDWLSGLQLDSLAIEKERGIIFSEWLSRQTAGQEVQEAFLNALLNGSRYADRKVIGDTAVILRAPAAEIRAYYQDWYSPSLAAVAIVGDIDAEWVEQRIKHKFNAIPRHDKQLSTSSIPNYTENRFKKVINDGERKAELNIIRLLEPAAPVITQEDHLQYLETDILRMLMRRRFSDLSFTSPPYSKGSVQSSNFLNTKRILLASVGINPDKPDSSITAFAAHVAQLTQYGFDANEIATVKKSYEAALKRKATSTKPTPSTTLMDEVYDDFYKGQPKISATQEYDWYLANINRIDSISLLARFHSWYYPDNAYYLLTGYSGIDSLLPDEDRIMDIFRHAQHEKQPRYQKTLAIASSLLDESPDKADIVQTFKREAIDTEEVQLSNGSRVLFRKPTIEKDRVTITGFRKGGLYALDSTDYVSGLYAGQVVALSGAGELDRESLAHYLTGSSASVRFLIDKTRSGIAGSAESTDLETLLQLIYLRWTSPKVDSSIFNQIKTKAIESYRHTQKTSSYIFGRDLGYIVNGHDYTTQEVTDLVIDKQLDQSRVLPVFNTAFGSATDFTFIVIADFEDEELKELILSYLGALPRGNPPSDYQYDRGAVNSDKMLVRNDGDTQKATVWLTYQTAHIPMSYHEFQLYSDIASAVLRTQLLKELREEMGKIYSVGVSASGTGQPSPLARTSIRFNCAPEDTELLINSIKERIAKNIAHPESMSSPLEDVKSNLRKEMELEKQRDSFWSSYIRNSLFNGDESLLFVTQFDEKLEAITAAKLADFIRVQIGQLHPIIAIQYPADFKLPQDNN